MYRPKYGKLERLLESQKILEIVKKRKKELEDEIESLERDLEKTLATNSYMEQNRLRIGEDFRNDRIGQDFRADRITGDYRLGYKVTSSNLSFDEDISGRFFH